MNFGRINWRMPATRAWNSKQYGPPQYTRDIGMYDPNYYADYLRPVTRCFKCKMAGHIAKYCHVKIPNGRKNKSQRKKDRDQKRLIEFRNRKNTCAVMPFCGVSDSEMLDFMPKWRVMQKAAVKPRNILSPEAFQDISSVKLVKENLNSDVERLNRKINDQEILLHEKQKELLTVQAKCADQLTEMEQLKRRLEDNEFVSKFLEQQFYDAKERAQKAEKELADLKTRKIQPQQHSLETTINSQKMELMMLNGKNAQLQEQNSGLLDELVDLRRKVYNSVDYGHVPSRRTNRRR